MYLSPSPLLTSNNPFYQYFLWQIMGNPQHRKRVKFSLTVSLKKFTEKQYSEWHRCPMACQIKRLDDQEWLFIFQDQRSVREKPLKKSSEAHYLYWEENYTIRPQLNTGS